MQIEHEGMRVWFGTADAPGPGDVVKAGTPVPITVGVEPPHTNNSVDVSYRVNNGPWRSVPARFLRNDVGAGKQYFQAILPGFNGGEQVTYTVQCHCLSHETPEDLESHVLSFQVERAGQPMLSERGPGMLAEAAALRPEAVAMPSAPVFALPRVPSGAPPTFTTAPSLPTSSGDAGVRRPPENGEEVYRGPFVVHGTIRQPDCQPLVRGVVEAVDKDLRSEQQLGQAFTDENGKYEIPYTAEQFRRSEKRTADLVVRVWGQKDGARVLLASSPIIFNAEREETVDLVAGGGECREPSEYERLMAEIAPLLENTPIGVLTEDAEHQDITFLSNETGQNAEHISFLPYAHRFGSQTDLPPDVFYGLFRKNFPTDFPALLAKGPQLQRRALESAIRENIIPARLSDQLDAIIERLHLLAARSALDSASDGGSLGALLSTGVQARDIQEKFLTEYLHHDGSVEDFWAMLRQHADFNDRLVDSLQMTLWLGAFARGHLPLVEELQRLRQTQEIRAPQDLAKFDENQWQAIIQKSVDGTPIGFPPDVPGANDEEKAATYARTLVRTMEVTFPTAVVAARLAKDAAPQNKDLVTFFARNPDFDLGATHLDVYTETNPAAFAGTEDPAKAKAQLEGMQRVFKLTPRYEEMRTVLNDGLDSAHSVVSFTKGAFVATYAEALGGAPQAEAIYNKAEQVTAAALLLFAKYSPKVNSVDLSVTPALPG